MTSDNAKIDVRLALVNYGVYTACEIAKKHGVKFEQCKSCDALAPAIDGECLLCGRKAEPVVEPEKVIETEPVKHSDKVYARLTSIALECWQNCNSPLPFHAWMERKGLHMDGGFFKAVEEPVEMRESLWG